MVSMSQNSDSWFLFQTPSIDVSHQSPSLLLEQPQQRRPQPFEGVFQEQRQPGCHMLFLKKFCG